MDGGLMETVRTWAEWAAGALELVGVAVICVMAVYALVLAGVGAARRDGGDNIFRDTRHRLVRGILLGLEFLVAADIIHTVAVDLTFESVGVLAAVVAIRTFLSFALEVEMTGEWPWQGKPSSRSA